MSTVKKLRLGPLPSSSSVKLTFTCSLALKTELDRYAAVHAQAYGEAVDAEKLISHMLEAFMAGDRGFARNRKIGNAPAPASEPRRAPPVEENAKRG